MSILIRLFRIVISILGLFFFGFILIASFIAAITMTFGGYFSIGILLFLLGILVGISGMRSSLNMLCMTS